MDINQLLQLGLAERWPKLKKHLEEVASFEKQRQQAEAKVGQLRAGIPQAREKDLDAEAQAARAGKGIPKPKHEPKLRGELDKAEREAVVMARAAAGASADLAAFMAKHQQALFEDVLQARREIAAEAAQAARVALQAFGAWHALGYTLKDLAPPPEAPEVGPAKNTNAFIGIHTRQSAGPDRGTVEQMLSYVASLEDVA